MSIELVEVDPCSQQHCRLLYALLDERTAEQSISHKEMPSYDQHLVFVASKPYKAWYLVSTDEGCAGSVYLTRQSEIGIAVFEEQRGRGYAEAAIKMLMKYHEGPFLANINPGNWASRCLFHDLGFKFIQVTYSHD
jgi:RimJ/RimL family protein N-acetyltransferase